jgi:hypothetical protein
MPTLSTRHLGYKAAQSLYYSIAGLPERIGYPLTHLVTINFADTDIPPGKAVEVFSALRRSRFNKWATRPPKGKGAAFPPTYAYCFENARGLESYDEIGPGLPHNTHVHWLVHIPPRRLHDFMMRLNEWLDHYNGRVCASNVISIEPVYYIPNLRQYVLKGAAAPWAKRFGADPRGQGLIVGGRRSGTSANLAVSVRRRLDRQDGIRRQDRVARGRSA